MPPLKSIVALAVVISIAGCGGRPSASDANASVAVASYAERQQRVAYSGAPPVIPHPPLSGKCVNCHTAAGTVLPGLGIAPANPHTQTHGMSAQSRCRQCHVFSNSDSLFVESEFEPLKRVSWQGARAAALAPPMVPHSLFMREDCAACHTGLAARAEIRCTHPERFRCRQCHVAEQNQPGTTLPAPEFTADSTLSRAMSR